MIFLPLEQSEEYFNKLINGEIGGFVVIDIVKFMDLLDENRAGAFDFTVYSDHKLLLRRNE